jgi:Protein of unknown function (DUF3037)
MAERRKLEFFVLRYVPNAVKGEFVNFGLVTVGDGVNGAQLIDVRFTKDRSRILCFDPEVDLDVLTTLQKEIQHEIGQAREQAVLLRRIEDSFSGVIQMSPIMPALTGDPANIEIENVARIFLETPKLRRHRESIGRVKIWERMRDEFESAGVLKLLTPVPAEPYSKAGDPFEFDFGYRVRNENKLFHAVSMRGSVDAAVLLAARYSRIAPEMARLTEAAPMLTAVVEADLDRNRSEIGFALEMMQESRIRVTTTDETAQLAATARVELGA